MNKKEAAAALGVSERTIERYVSEGKLHPTYRKGKTNKVADFSEEEIEFLRKEGKVPPVGIEHKLLLSIEEAAAVSGMTITRLEKALTGGELKLVDGKIRRSDLEAFVARL